MKLYLNRKKIFCFLGVLLFAFNVNADIPATCLTYVNESSKYPNSEYKNKYTTWEANNPGGTSEQFCKSQKSPATGTCSAAKKEYNKNWNAFQTACNANRTQINADTTETTTITQATPAAPGTQTTTYGNVSAQKCAEAINKCKSAYTDVTEITDEAEKIKYAKEIKLIEKNNKKIGDLDDLFFSNKESDEAKNNAKEIEKLKTANQNTLFFKQCPIQAALAGKSYKKALKDQKDTIKDLINDHDDIKDKITELERERDTEIEERDNDINTLGEGVLKNAREFKTKNKALKEKLKTKISGKTKEIETSQTLIKNLNLQMQKLANDTQKQQFEREDKCHGVAAKAVTKRQKNRVRKILNNTNHVSFSVLIKRSKLSRKDRDKIYKQSMYKECLNTPEAQKWLKRHENLVAQQKLDMLTRQKGAVDKIKAAQEGLEKIASENHVEAGELIEESKKDADQISQKLSLANTNKERVVNSFNKQIAQKKEQLKQVQLDLQEAKLPEEAAAAKIAKGYSSKSKLSENINTFSDVTNSMAALKSATEGHNSACLKLNNQQRSISNSIP